MVEFKDRFAIWSGATDGEPDFVRAIKI